MIRRWRLALFLVVDHYTVQRLVVLTLRDVDRFEEVLMGELDAGANHIYHIDFRTSELRRFADEARALALKAAYEKARDLASVGGFTVSEQPSDVFSANTELKTWYSVSPGDSRAIRAATSTYQNSAVLSV